MNLANDITIILLSTGFFSWLFKIIIEKSLDAKLEKYKSRLEMGLEKYKAELGQIVSDHNVRFSKLYETQAFTIKKAF